MTGSSSLTVGKDESVMESTTIAVDLAKSVFEVAVSRRPGVVSARYRFSWEIDQPARPSIGPRGQVRPHLDGDGEGRRATTARVFFSTRIRRIGPESLTIPREIFVLCFIISPALDA